MLLYIKEFVKIVAGRLRQFAKAHKFTTLRCFERSKRMRFQDLSFNASNHRLMKFLESQGSELPENPTVFELDF